MTLLSEIKFGYYCCIRIKLRTLESKTVTDLLPTNLLCMKSNDITSSNDWSFFLREELIAQLSIYY